MGTALTERQVALLKRYTRRPDARARRRRRRQRGDAARRAGRRRRSRPRVDAAVPNWRGVVRHQETLDGGHPRAHDARRPRSRRGDPQRARALAELVDAAKPVLDHLFDVAAERHDLSQPRERSAVAARTAPMIIAADADRVVQSHYMQRLARMRRSTKRRSASRCGGCRRARGRRRSAARAAAMRPNLTSLVRCNRLVRDAREEFCLALLFRYPELRAEGLDITPELFGQSENRALFDAWIEWSDEGESFEASLTPDLRPQYERVVNLDLPAFDDDAFVKALRSTVGRIEQQRLRSRQARKRRRCCGHRSGRRRRRSPNARWSAGDRVARPRMIPHDR